MGTLSDNNQKIKQLAKLNMSKYRKEMKLFIVEGKHLVDEAIREISLYGDFEWFVDD